MVATGSIVMMAVNALVGIAVPVLLGCWIVKKCKASWKSVLIGAGVFVVFALILEAIVHQVVLKGPSGPTILGNTWYYALYGGLMAGLFEETGRLLSMKFLLKKEPSGSKTGVAYGIGHGGMEMLMIFGISMISNIVVALFINIGQTGFITAGVPEASQAQLQAQFAQLESLTVGTLLIGMWERFSAIVLQIGLSLLVWTAVRRGRCWLWLFPAAILLHALVNAGAVMLSNSAGIVVTEIVISAEAIAVIAMGWMLARKLDAVPVPEAAPQPEAK